MKTTSQEDDLTERGPHWKKTSLEDNLTGRRPHRKTISQEDNLTGKQPYRKMTPQEDDLTGRQLHRKTNWQEDELGTAQPQLVFTFCQFQWICNSLRTIQQCFQRYFWIFALNIYDSSYSSTFWASPLFHVRFHVRLSKPWRDRFSQW